MKSVTLEGGKSWLKHGQINVHILRQEKMLTEIWNKLYTWENVGWNTENILWEKGKCLLKYMENYITNKRKMFAEI